MKLVYSLLGVVIEAHKIAAYGEAYDAATELIIGSLTSINLSRNNLQGTIQEALGTLTCLQNLHLVSASLEGGILKSFGNFSYLDSLYLTGNNLCEDLPSFFRQLAPTEKSIRVLDLSSNNFTAKLKHMSNLLIIDLADNHISGFLPDLSVLSSLWELFFEKNRLEGTLGERKFLRALHPKWRAKVTEIKESKDLTSPSLDELIGNLKVHKMIIKKDSKIVKAKVERKSLALKVKKESSDEECSTSRSEDEEYAMAVRDFKKLFKCGNPNHLIGKCPKPPKDKNQRAFVGGSWSDSGEEDDEKVNNETCLVAQASSGNEKLKEEVTRLNKFEKSTQCLNEMLSKQKPSGEKLGLGFNSFEASSSGTKEIKFMKAQKKVSSDGGPINMGGPQSIHAASKTIMGLPPVGTPGSEKSICLGVDLEPNEWIKDNGCSKHMSGNQKLFSSYKAYNGVNVIFGSNLRGNIIGKEPKNVNEALADGSWIIAMQEELNQFITHDVWELVSQLKNMTIIGTKWVFRNKLDENGIVSQNKARLVSQGYNQQEGINYDETYASVARLESIRILLAYACALDFKLFQMDVKSAFLNGFINEDVYVAQPLGFIDFEKLDHVYKLKKALYDLKQAPKAWKVAMQSVGWLEGATYKGGDKDGFNLVIKCCSKQGGKEVSKGGVMVMCTLPTQGMRSIISMVSISPEGFMPSILLVVVINVTVVIVVFTVILVVVVVAIIGVVIVVTIIGVVVVVMIIGVVGVVVVSSIIKLSFVIIGFEAETFPSILLGYLVGLLYSNRFGIGIPPGQGILGESASSKFHFAVLGTVATRKYRFSLFKPTNETNSSFRTIEVERLTTHKLFLVLPEQQQYYRQLVAGWQPEPYPVLQMDWFTSSDEDPTNKDGDIRMDDSTGFSASLGGEIFLGGKKCWESKH
ncbi:retrovirus-related pol polyprotein from transposon TNT 1-94 [Tanacetum coccineum]